MNLSVTPQSLYLHSFLKTTCWIINVTEMAKPCKISNIITLSLLHYSEKCRVKDLPIDNLLYSEYTLHSNYILVTIYYSHSNNQQ